MVRLGTDADRVMVRLPDAPFGAAWQRLQLHTSDAIWSWCVDCKGLGHGCGAEPICSTVPGFTGCPPPFGGLEAQYNSWQIPNVLELTCDKSTKTSCMSKFQSFRDSMYKLFQL